MTMHIQALPQKTAELLQLLQDQNFLSPFYLTGGTALSLEIGHRESEDLDFFSKKTFDPLDLQQKLSEFCPLENVQVEEGTLNLFLNGVKLQFLHYPYQLLKPPILWNGINISSDFDIACTKLVTISSRGSKKDFIDLFFLLKTYTLPELFEALPEKYTGTDYNQTHILKSLLYFEDAEEQPMPRMHKEVSWEEIKKGIIQSVKSVDLSAI